MYSALPQQQFNKTSSVRKGLCKIVLFDLDIYLIPSLITSVSAGSQITDLGRRQNDGILPFQMTLSLPEVHSTGLLTKPTPQTHPIMNTNVILTTLASCCCSSSADNARYFLYCGVY